MASEAGACQTRNVGSYEDDEEEEKQAAPLDEASALCIVCVCCVSFPPCPQINRPGLG